MSAQHQVLSDWDGYSVQIMLAVNVVVNLWRFFRHGQQESEEQRFYLYSAALWMVLGIINFVNGAWSASLVCAAFMAWDLRQWWKHGGGDGTKRRLKKLKEKFVARRRTAPVTA